MKSLKDNIALFKKIESNYGSIDNFINQTNLKEIVKLFSDADSPYKLKQMGVPLVMEYLKNVGITVLKPDVHIVRICGPERLDLLSTYDINNLTESIEKFSKAVNLNITYLDNLFWIFGARKYGDICISKPKCDEKNCQLNSYCNYPNNSTKMR